MSLNASEVTKLMERVREFMRGYEAARDNQTVIGLNVDDQYDLALSALSSDSRPRAEVMHIAFLSKDRTDTEGYFARELVRLADRAPCANADRK